MCAYLEDMAFLSFLEIGDLKVTIFLYLSGSVKAKPNLSRYSLSSPNPPRLFRSVCAMLEADSWGVFVLLCTSWRLSLGPQASQLHFTDVPHFLWL